MGRALTELLWPTVWRLALLGAYQTVVFGLLLGMGSGLEGLGTLIRFVGDMAGHLAEPTSSNVPPPDLMIVAWGAGGAALGLVTMLAGWWGVQGIGRGLRARAMRGALFGLATSVGWFVVITWGPFTWSGFSLDLAPRLMCAGQLALLVCCAGGNFVRAQKGSAKR